MGAGEFLVHGYSSSLRGLLGEHITICFKNHQSHEKQNLNIFTTKKIDILFFSPRR